MRRRGPFAFVAFDVLALNGKDVRKLPLIERKRLLHAIVPKRSATIIGTTHIAGRGRDLFAEVSFVRPVNPPMKVFVQKEP